MNETSVTVIGLGAMGSALANEFVRQGHTTTVWNRTPERADPLVAAGARRAGTVADAVAASPLVVACVLNNDVVRRLLEPAPLSGKVLVNLATGTPRQARDIAEWAVRCGADYLDGGIMAVPPMIGRPGARIFYSGSPAAFERHREALAVLAEPMFFGSDPGRAALYDVALLSAMNGMFGGFLHSVALVRSAGILATEFMALLTPWLAAMQSGMPTLAERIDSGRYGDGVVSPLAMQAAGAAHLVETAEEHGVRPDVLLPLNRLMDDAVASGHGEHDLAAVIEVMGR